MSPQSYSTENSQQRSDYPTSPWTETFHFCAGEMAQSQSMPAAENRSSESDSQWPTQEALSAIYNQEW